MQTKSKNNEYLNKGKSEATKVDMPRSFSLSQGSAHLPSQACSLFLYGLETKNTFYIFQWLKTIKSRMIFHDTWEFYEIQISVSINKASWHTAPSIRLHVVHAAPTLQQQSPRGPQSLKYLLFTENVNQCSVRKVYQSRIQLSYYVEALARFEEWGGFSKEK